MKGRGRFMDKEKALKSIALRAAIIILAAIFICVGFDIYINSKYSEAQKVVDEEYANKYDIECKALGFLEDDKDEYKKAVIRACEAYDLTGLDRISIVGGSLKDNKEAGTYEWKIRCNDSKNTSFVCSFKKSTKEISVEREYAEDLK